jgi:hypothetical protein
MAPALAELGAPNVTAHGGQTSVAHVAHDLLVRAAVSVGRGDETRAKADGVKVSPSGRLLLRAPPPNRPERGPGHPQRHAGGRQPRCRRMGRSAWLQRHEVAAVPMASLVVGDDAADLSELAHEHDADLIVAGAYGHSRLQEWAFGGVTRDLLTRKNRCVLLSH